MRIGFNPNKDKTLVKSEYNHQVIVPVYIPNQEGYFKDSFQILQFCLESLFKTSHSKTYFTIVNNGSCEVVTHYLNALSSDGKIQEIIHTTAIGKLNAILKGLTGHSFKLITITDADVLFVNDWQKAAYQVFKAFPKVGVVCTTPSSKSFNDKTFNIYFDNFFSANFQFTTVHDSVALKRFAISVGNPGFYNETHLSKYLTVSKNGIAAVVGAGHFVGTYRGSVFSDLGITSTYYSLGGSSETELLDVRVINKGYWRLSTLGNYTYHMGNTVEPWMNDKFDALSIEINQVEFKVHPDLNKPSAILFWIKNKLLEKLFYRKSIRRLFLKNKGLTKQEAKNY